MKLAGGGIHFAYKHVIPVCILLAKKQFISYHIQCVYFTAKLAVSQYIHNNLICMHHSGHNHLGHEISERSSWWYAGG